MSRSYTDKVTCPNCNHTGDFEIWESVNTMLDPELKEKVLNHDIFHYTCPNCGETYTLVYPTLYHQMEDCIMIYLVSESEIEKTCQLLKDNKIVNEFNLEKYLYRVVTSCNQLTEKIHIFDAGKDDRIIELAKLIVANHFQSQYPDRAFDDIIFDTDENGSNFFVLFNEGEYVTATEVDSIYDNLSKASENWVDIRDDDIVINQEWILNRIEEEES